MSILVGLAPAAAAAAALVASEEEVADSSAAAFAVVALPRAMGLAFLMTTVAETAHDSVFSAVSDMVKTVDAWDVLTEVGDPSGATALAIAIQRGEPEPEGPCTSLLSKDPGF